MVRLKESWPVTQMPSSAPTRPDPTRARYEALLEVAESIASHRQLSTLFADLSRLLKRLVPFDFISLTLIDPKERVVRLHILETEQPIVGKPRRESTPFDQTPTSAGPGNPARLTTFRTLAEETRFPVIRDLLRANGMQSTASCRCSPRSANWAGCTSARCSRNAYSAGRHRIHGAGGAPGGGGGGQRAELGSRPWPMKNNWRTSATACAPCSKSTTRW